MNMNPWKDQTDVINGCDFICKIEGSVIYEQVCTHIHARTGTYHTHNKIVYIETRYVTWTGKTRDSVGLVFITYDIAPARWIRSEITTLLSVYIQTDWPIDSHQSQLSYIQSQIDGD